MSKKIKKASDTANYCFIISPIGEKGTEKYNDFKEVYDYIIKPAITNSDYDVKVIRADDIERSGSFINDILENLLNSFIVIADLTGQNPNVFYELGVRHALSPRTILIAQSIDDIPSDLREYRTIIYDNSAKGAREFADRLTNYFKEIFKGPSRPDNPVANRLGSIMENKTYALEAEIIKLKSELTKVLQKGISKKSTSAEEDVSTRMDRIFKLKRAENQAYSLDSGSVVFGEGDKEQTIHLQKDQGNFNLYYLMNKDGTIDEYWYVSSQNTIKIEKELADIRVLIDACLNKLDIEFKFILATNQGLRQQQEFIQNSFIRMLEFIPKKQRKRFSLEIWDKEGLVEQEKILGLKIEI